MDKKKNYQANIDYFAKAIKGSNYKPNSFKAEDFVKLDISQTSFKKAAGSLSTHATDTVSDATLEKIAYSFSHYIINDLVITSNDLKDDVKSFKSKFPSEVISSVPKPHISPLDIFFNQLYRCYYLVTNTEHTAYSGFFKLFKYRENDEVKYSARLIRGISNEKEAAADALKKALESDDPAKIDTEFANQKDKNITNKKKSAESYHLYIAEHSDIRISDDCIKIDLKSTDSIPCYCTLIWNIQVPLQFAKDSMEQYVGGSCLAIDTNEGMRGKSISAFKINLEVIADINMSDKQMTKKYMDENPFCLNSPVLLNELQLTNKNGIPALTNDDDSRWYRFISENSYRKKEEKLYSLEDLRKLSKELRNIQYQYEINLQELKEILQKYSSSSAK